MTKKKSAHTEETDDQEVKTQSPVDQPEVDMPDEAQAPIESQVVEDQTEKVQELENELSTVKAKADEYLDGWQRSRADFANYKRRVERDQEQMYQTTAGNIIKRYLDIVDDLSRALKNRPQEGDGAAWAQGIELINRKLLNILESESVKPMDAEGQQFDPNRHEAITHEEAPDFESGQIIEVVSPGYMLGDRVLRPALVRVAK